MALIDLLNAGAIAGLLAAIFNGFLTPILAPLKRRQPALLAASEPTTTSAPLLIWLLYLLTGTGLGLLFWLTWGIVAVVNISWWQRGLVFALTIWMLTCLPLATNLLITRRWHWSTALTTVIEWLSMLMFVGLACAWRWTARML